MTTQKDIDTLVKAAREAVALLGGSADRPATVEANLRQALQPFTGTETEGAGDKARRDKVSRSLREIEARASEGVAVKYVASVLKDAELARTEGASE